MDWINSLPHCMVGLSLYRLEATIKKEIRTDIYQAQMLHCGFAQTLNVVILCKTNLKTGARAHVILFSSDLSLCHTQIGDTFGWLNSTTFFQFGSGRENKIWRINANENPFVTLEETYDGPPEIGNDFQGVTLLPNGHLRFSASQINIYPERVLCPTCQVFSRPTVPSRLLGH